MTTRDDFDRSMSDFDRLMTAWFDAEAHVREPDDLFERTVARTAGVRPRPAWLLPERWLPMELTMRPVSVPRGARAGVLLVVLLLLAALAVIAVGSQRRVPAPFGPAFNGRVAIVELPGLHAWAVRVQVLGQPGEGSRGDGVAAHAVALQLGVGDLRHLGRRDGGARR